MKQKPKAILFDLDDTLISFDGISRQAWETSCAAFLQAHALPVDQAELLQALEATRKWFWSDPERHKEGRENIPEARRVIVRRAFSSLGIQSDALAAELADRYSALHLRLIHLYPETPRVLNALRQGGYRLGLVTNGTSAGQREKINRFGLAPFFEIILIEQEVGFGKPDPRVYERACALLALDASSLWMVGDNLDWDIRSPQTLGIYAVWHDAKNAGLPAGGTVTPDAVIRSIGELPGLLAND